MMCSDGKYFDWENSRPFNTAEDGCPAEQWNSMHDRCAFAVHPNGFLIFLPPPQLQPADEYSEADPYTVDIDAPFHSRRIDLTGDLLAEAATKTTVRKVLDIGCGEGHITEILRRMLPDVEFSGLDYSVSAVVRGSLEYPEIDFVVADAYEPPYSPGYFDVVICNNLWEHVPDPLRLLSGISRILRKGGYLILSTPSRYHFQNMLRVVLGQSVRFASTHHVTEYTVDQVSEQLLFGGFVVDRWASRPLASEVTTWKLKVLYSTLVPLVRGWLRRFDRHHSLETTVFALARKSI